MRLFKTKNKKVNASEEDKQAIKYLRQKILTNDIQLKTGIITEEEYEVVLKDIAKQVLLLEAKYEL